MKRSLIVLSICLLFAYIFLVSYADYGTNVEYLGNGTEEYTVTVPAKMSPNDYGNVIVEGEWASDRIVNVTADESVELVNSINVFNRKTLDINFSGISANGDDLSSKKIEETILVNDLDSKILFGEWKGNFNYNVEIVDSKLYYGRVYRKQYSDDESASEAVDAVVVYNDNSSTSISSDGTVEHYSSEDLSFEDDYMIQSGERFLISDDRTKFSYLDPSTSTPLAIWELLHLDNVVDNSFPISVNMNDLAGNYKADFFGNSNIIKISDIVLSEHELLNTKLNLTIDGETQIFNAKDSVCLNKEFCLADYGEYALISIKTAHYFYDSFFIYEPGLYFFDISDFGNDIKIEISLDDTEQYNLEWKVKDVVNNKTVDYNGEELVKVSDEVKEIDFYKNSMFNVVVDGIIVNFSYTDSNDDGPIYKLEYRGGYKYIIVVTESGKYDGVTFDEVGVYAFNFGKFDKNYTINIGKMYSPNFEYNAKTDGKYYNGEKYYTFTKSSYTYSDGTSDIHDSFDRTINLQSGIFATISKDGNSIKIHKYLSNSWIYEENDDIIFTYDN